MPRCWQRRVGGRGRRRSRSAHSVDPARRAALRQEANEALAAEVKARAADTLDKVLFELSSNMKNAYSRSDM